MAGTDFEHIPRLHYISQGEVPEEHISHILRMSEAGIPLVQLRLKDMSEKEVLSWAEKAMSICDHNSTLLVVNDFPKVAAEVGAWGIHLGLSDDKISLARNEASNQVIGGTANSSRDLIYQIEQGADYIGLGPYRFTLTKEKLSPVLGIQGIKQCCKLDNSVPIIAVGGIIPQDVKSILEAGAHGVAVSGSLTRCPDPKLVIEAMLQVIQQYKNLAHA